VLDGDLASRLIDLDDLTVGQRRLRERSARRQAEQKQSRGYPPYITRSCVLSFDDHRAAHAGFQMAGNEASEFEPSAPGEFPEDRTRCERR
jgi:hypothetical protein